MGGSCISDNNICRVENKLKQNDNFNVCVYATSPLIKNIDIVDMKMVQGDEGNKVVEDLVTDGVENLFSKKITSDEGCVVGGKQYNGAMVSTLITSKFFAGTEPKPVLIQGNVDLGFVKRRKLKEVNRDETKEGKFQLGVPLIPSTRTAFEATSEDDGTA